MRIAIFTDTFTPEINGVAKVFERFTNYLTNEKIEYRIFAPKSTNNYFYSSRVYDFISLPFFLYPECRLALPNLTHVKNELQRFKPDIIHIATPFNMGLCGLRYGRKLNIPMVSSYQSDFHKYLESYDLQFLANELWKYMRWFHRPMQKVFVPSEDTKKQLQNHGFTELSVWPNGVDCSLFHPDYDLDSVREKYKIKEKYILLFVGRIAPEKDVMLLPEIANSLPKEVRRGCHWLVVGDGPIKKKLEKSAPENMTFTGFLSGTDLAEVYSAADLFVFPSPSETFGNVILESLASGTPVVGVNAGGVKTIVNNGITGLLCEEKDSVDFVNAITSLLDREHTRQLMGDNGRNYALSQSWETIFDHLLREYEKTLKLGEDYKELALS